MRVLVIDDEPILLAAARRVLGTAHDVTTSSDGASALALLAQNDFDVVLCDLMLSDTEGVEVYERAVRARPDIEPRFLFMTGGSLTARSDAFRTWLGRRCLSKPFDAATLIEAVRSFAATLPTRSLRRPSRRLARIG